MMRLLFLLSVFIAVASAFPGIVTPIPIAPGIPDNCVDFAKAIPGDTCDFLALKNGLDTAALLQVNPQIGGPHNCPEAITVDYWYCVHTVVIVNVGGGPAPPTSAPTQTAVSAILPPQSQATDRPMSRVSAPYSDPPPPPATTSSPPPPPPATTTPPPPPPPPPKCPRNDCWRAFRLAGEDGPSYSSWCSSVITAGPGTVGYDDFPGIPPLVQSQCSPLGPASDVVPSYCRCFTAGQITGTTSKLTSTFTF